MAEQWINAVVTITVPLDLSVDASLAARQEALEEVMNDVVIDNDVVVSGHTELVEDGQPQEKQAGC